MLKTFDDLNKSSCSECFDMSCAVSLLNKEEFELLSNHSIESKIKKGEVIQRSDILISNIIYLKTGYVKEYILGANNKSRIIQIVKPHSYLGIHSIFGDKINHYSYAALEDLTICYIDISIFRKLIKDNGNFAYQIITEMGKENLYNYFRLITDGYRKIDGRFAETMLYLSEKIYESNNFKLQLSRQDLANLMGISRENLIRVMMKFRKEGLIEISRDNLTILNPKLLKIISKNG